MTQPEARTDHDRCKKVDEVMANLRTMLANEDFFEVVHPARWKHTPTGKHIETGYTRGEGRVRIYEGGSREPVAALTFLGGKYDHVNRVVEALYPPTSAA